MKNQLKCGLKTLFTEGNEGNEERRLPEGRAPTYHASRCRAPRNSLRYLRSLLFIFPVAAVVLLPAATRAQAIEAWVQRDNGPVNGGASAAALAVDTNGTVYVTGSAYGGDPPSGGSYYDFATIAYSSDGVPLWTNRYSSPGGWQDYASAVLVDGSGDVVVTGSSRDASGDSHCTTLKYTSAGVPLWTNIYSAPGTGGKALAIDPSGNVFVTGTSWQGSSDYLTLKCSSAGTLLWARQYNGPAGGNDDPVALAVDRSGNVFVTGSSAGIGGANDYATIKYSASGAQLWVQRYNAASSNLDDQAKALAVDADGNVYVTGMSPAISGDWDYATIKYSNTGTPLWTNRYGKPGYLDDRAFAIAVDPSSNIVVTGSSSTIKYTSAGVPLWTNLIADGALALAIDRNGNIYVTGDSMGSGTGLDYVTTAYSSVGVPLWTNRYNGPGNGWDTPEAIAVDASGNVYVVGVSADNNAPPYESAFTTIKYVAPPIITRQPLSCTNTTGTTASFTVEVAGSAPFAYQWLCQGRNLLDGGKFSGVTTTNLLIANLQPADAADYSVIITNAYGSVTSSVATLTVTISANAGRFTDLSYSPVTGLSFFFRDGTVGQPYRIQVSASLAGGWVDWTSFNYTAPRLFADMAAVGISNRFYRAVSP